MMKSINISTKFTILILVVSLIAVAAISFFSYDYHLKANKEKFATNLSVIADNQTAYFNSYFERAERAVQFLQSSDKLKTELANGGGSSEGGGMDFLMAPIGSDESGNDDSGTEESESDSTETEISFGPGENSSLAGYLKEMKATLGVSEITITSGTGAVQATTDPTVKTSVVDPDGVSFDRARTGI